MSEKVTLEEYQINCEHTPNSVFVKRDLDGKVHYIDCVVFRVSDDYCKQCRKNCIQTKRLYSLIPNDKGR